MSSSRPTAARPRILYVEDDEELRESLGEFLEDAGYDVDFASSADDGLTHLADEHYDLVLTDYSMPPGVTGAAMLERADAKGLLRGTAKLMVTASEDREGTNGLCIIRKPVDVDVLLMRIEEQLEGKPQVAPKVAAVARSDDATQPVPRVALVLYVSSGSPSSARALRNLRRLLALYPEHAIALVVRDLARQPLGPNEERVPFTPTLVRREPGPSTWVIGDLDNIKPVVDLIEDAGVEKKS